MTNPNGFRGRYTLGTAVVGQIGLALLDDGSLWLVLLQEGYSKIPAKNHTVVAPMMVRGPSR